MYFLRNPFLITKRKKSLLLPYLPIITNLLMTYFTAFKVELKALDRNAKWSKEKENLLSSEGCVAVKVILHISVFLRLNRKRWTEIRNGQKEKKEENIPAAKGLLLRKWFYRYTVFLTSEVRQVITLIFFIHWWCQILIRI